MDPVPVHVWSYFLVFKVNTGISQLGDIFELNLRYLSFAQRELQRDFQGTCAALSLPASVAETLATLTPTQMTKLATAQFLLLRFNWDDALILESLTDKAPTVLTAPVPTQHLAEMAECAQAA
ncbi:flagellar transcriptional regulator FlhD [Paraburkholderia sp. A3RO-2L]|uniref:flagellar transcriptional regulator FlhD n=1 Tax=unclassified Paraburkholderia TaxID=2615204 RepID=UPI003DA81B65